MSSTSSEGWPFGGGFGWVQQVAEELCSRAEEYGRPRRPGRHGRGPRGFGGPPFVWPWAGGPPRPRPRRGDVRLAVLTLLAEQPMHGYQIITELSERSRGMWRPSPGSVYPTLQQLEDEGLVSVAERDGRRTFSLTPAGEAELERAARGRRAPWEEMAEGAEEDAGGLRGLALQVMAAAMQVSVVGSADQVVEAEEILALTRRNLYRMLAEEDDVEEDDR